MRFCKCVAATPFTPKPRASDMYELDLISCERVAPAQVKIAILPQFLPIDPHFVRKGCSRTSKIGILPQFLPIDPHFVRKGCSGASQIAILLQFFADRPSFRAKGLLQDKSNRNFTSVFCRSTPHFV